MKKQPNMKKMKQLTTVFFVLAALLAVITISFAAYTSISSVKRVVTVKGTEQLFTSDILMPYEDADNLESRVISFGAGATDKSFEVNISNHIQGDVSKYDAKGFSYTFNMELFDRNGNRVTDAAVYQQLKINGTAMSANPYAISGVFPGGASKDDLYKFTLTDDLMACKLKLTAVSSVNTYKPLGRLISFTTDKTSANWTGEFMTAEKVTAVMNKELGMINYLISGHVEEDCVLSWDATRVDIDQWFLDDLGVTPEEGDGGRKMLRLHLGAENTPDQYIITFYRTYAVSDLESETWDDIQSYISFTNSKDTSGGSL
ncbi:MAG: hypothetical protein Q4B73_09110 [Lachnospiraceae bacterium]|nr:hypothetical protein [Lachnospiraceae bacterium]